MDQPRPNIAANRQAAVRDMLIAIADRLTARRPGKPFTQVGRIAVIQSTTLDPVLARVLRERMPEVDGPVSRGAFAAMLRELVGAPVPAPDGQADDSGPSQPHLWLNYTPLSTPAKETMHEVVQSVDAARHVGRGILAEYSVANVHSAAEMIQAASGLHYALRSLLEALDAELGPHPLSPEALRARRVAALHAQCDADFASSEDRRVQDHRDDAHLIAGASEAARQEAADPDRRGE